MAATRAAAMLLVVLAPAGHAALLSAGSQGACPSTSISYAISTDAAGTEQWMPPCEATVPGQCVPAGVDTSSFPVSKLKICGPGKFSISRMSCDRHDYKAETYVHPTDEFTATTCKVYDLTGTNVHGFVGSFSYECDTTAR
ncbi:unnamed protein product [Prorocentrum cordatum]|uniref:Uncharacterized protein n=1 Tax=Prorocentrum cordatum TaxID=2364126 RepID=A0ABN9RH88_9DINO|nr:unnamed protein product [Polarella glacialis]